MNKAAFYDQVGGPEVLYVGEAKEQELAANQVLLQVQAAGLNPYDAKVREGAIPSKAAFPRRIGSDVAGVVEVVGDDALYWDGTAIQEGDRVMGRAAGSVAQFAVATDAGLARQPEGLSNEVAGALNVAALTAVSCLIDVPVGPEDTLLVGGGTGAVGMIVAQLALAEGAKVLATGSAKNAEFLQSLGVTPVTYGEGLEERVADLGPITAVIDTHGSEALQVGCDLGVAPERMTATSGGAQADALGVKPVTFEGRTARNLSALAERIAAGALKVPIAASFPLDEVVEAFEYLEASHPPGKVVVLP